MTSGAIQKGVPTNVSLLICVSVSCPATPKSASFTSPDSDRSTLAAVNHNTVCLICVWIYLNCSSDKMTTDMNHKPSVHTLRLAALLTLITRSDFNGLRGVHTMRSVITNSHSLTNTRVVHHVTWIMAPPPTEYLTRSRGVLLRSVGENGESLDFIWT